MRAAFKIFSALTVATLAYVWTVGQAGLETANKNICQLTNNFVAHHSCEVHYWFVGLWLTGLIASLTFIAVDFARFARRAATPYGGVVLFYQHYRTASAQRLRAYWSKVDPSHVIILGLVIAMAGLIWQSRRAIPADPLIATLQSQLASVQNELEEAKKKPLATSEDPSRPSMLTGRPVSGREVVTRLERLENDLVEARKQIAEKDKQIAQFSPQSSPAQPPAVQSAAAPPAPSPPPRQYFTRAEIDAMLTTLVELQRLLNAQASLNSSKAMAKMTLRMTGQLMPPDIAEFSEIANGLDDYAKKITRDTAEIKRLTADSDEFVKSAALPILDRTQSGSDPFYSALIDASESLRDIPSKTSDRQLAMGAIHGVQRRIFDESTKYGTAIASSKKNIAERIADLRSR